MLIRSETGSKENRAALEIELGFKAKVRKALKPYKRELGPMRWDPATLRWSVMYTNDPGFSILSVDVTLDDPYGETALTAIHRELREVLGEAPALFDPPEEDLDWKPRKKKKKKR